MAVLAGPRLAGPAWPARTRGLARARAPRDFFNGLPRKFLAGSDFLAAIFWGASVGGGGC